jgi:HEAT repeat protein
MRTLHFKKPEYQEALLQRALDALKSERQQLRTEALDQLARLLDPRATEALIAAANDGGELRVVAVEALTRHAATTGTRTPPRWPLYSG